ncbi:acyltransferase [Herbaspirillum sp. LeCh32-8]|uniref:acyltransferase family protein n=1 Tax=Herbaspirillum sp. LeCh32-8 TaxID=2821356 RepID=UPI001AE3692A|nr:acyltransferase [Herbaspirillum sp. LeCh32-8]MBP0596924.1 acyltransferase [Herbaspirillum sp. LeCh32-8]
MTDSSSTPASKQAHLPWLDGLRGLAAFWVLASHVQILSGLRDLPVLSWGGIAVDLFMLLSGFLMAHNYFLRRQAEPWGESRTFVLFWLRRFFRIAPLYYLLLIVAVGIGGMLADGRSAIAAIWPNTATPLRRYLDDSAINFLAHFSFAFGVLPDYAFRTALPDWSIGLEMQFYLVFPFVMLAVLRLGAYAGTFGALALCVATWFLFPGYFASFEMPAFIGMKLCVFMAGMWIAIGRQNGAMTRALAAALAMMVIWALVGRHLHAGEPRIQILCRLCIVVGMFYLMNDGSLPGSALLARPVAWLRGKLSGRVARFLGDTSYCTYLLHLLILLPVAGTLAGRADYVALPSPLRFLLCLALVLPPVYLISWGLFRTVETYGIHLGRKVVKAVGGTRPRAAVTRVNADAG